VGERDREKNLGNAFNGSIKNILFFMSYLKSEA
jgi:hypothetical protein